MTHGFVTERDRVPLGRAQVVAWKVREELEPYCERIEVAGSVRRRRESVKDVEILAAPLASRPDLLGLAQSDMLSDYLQRRLKAPGDRWTLRPNRVGRTSFGRLNKLMLYEDFPVDIFTAEGTANWGRDLMVRTGPKEWSVAFMQRLKDLGMAGHAYGPHAATRGDEYFDAPDEAAMFELLRWEPVAPEWRGIVTPKAAAA